MNFVSRLVRTDVRELCEKGRDVYVVGISNGVVAATETALQFQVRGLCCLSGAPTPEQSWMLSRLKVPIVYSVGAWEKYWGGPAGLHYCFENVKASCYEFDGSHASESPWVILKCLASLAL